MNIKIVDLVNFNVYYNDILRRNGENDHDHDHKNLNKSWKIYKNYYKKMEHCTDETQK